MLYLHYTTRKVDDMWKVLLWWCRLHAQLVFGEDGQEEPPVHYRGPPSPLWCALCSLAQSLACVKIWGAAPPNGRNIVSRKMSTWVAQYAPLELFCLWTKVHQISFVQRGRGCGWSSFFSDVRYVDPFRRYSRFVESCQKSRRNLNVFWPSQTLGGRPSKNCTHIITPASWHVD